MHIEIFEKNSRLINFEKKKYIYINSLDQQG